MVARTKGLGANLKVSSEKIGSSQKRDITTKGQACWVFFKFIGKSKAKGLLRGRFSKNNLW